MAGERGRRWSPAIPLGDDEVDGVSAPRRSTFAAARQPWWKPRTNFGRIVLGTGAFVVLSLLVALGLFIRHFLYRDPHFQIHGAVDIQASGLSEVNRAEFLPVFGPDIGRNIFFVPLDERRRELEAIPWVREATVMRLLPDKINVRIVERTPVAFVRLGQRIGLTDADGVILTMSPALMAQHHYSFPVVTGIGDSDSKESRRTKMAVYQRFLGELDASGRRRTDQVSEIDLSDPEDLRATMPEQGTDILAHFGEDQFLSRFEVYKGHVGEWRNRYPNLVGVDLRYSGEVPLEMAKGSARASVTAALSPDVENVAADAKGPAIEGNEAAASAGRTAAVAKQTVRKPPIAAIPKRSMTRPEELRSAHAHAGKPGLVSSHAAQLRREAQNKAAIGKAARGKTEKTKRVHDQARAGKQAAAHAITAR